MRAVNETVAMLENSLRRSTFNSDRNAALFKMGTEKVRQVLRCSLAIHFYGEKDLRVGEFVLKLFRDKDGFLSF